MIDDLPDVEEVKALDPEEDAETLEEIYLQAAEVADAFDTLSDEEQESVSNLDKLMELHEWFNGGVATMSSSVRKMQIVERDLYWELGEDGTLTITGTDAMPDWFIGGERPEVAPWYSCAGEIKKASIAKGVPSIGEYAFYECSALESITIPASVTTIDMVAFSNCAALKTVTFKGTAPPTIDRFAFSGCNNITTISFPPGSEAAYSKLMDVIPLKQSYHHHHSSGGGSTAAKTTTSADSSAAKSNSPFTDVSEADWFYPDVAFVYACGLLGGTIDGSFEPYASVSRLSLAELFYRMEGSPAVTGRNHFRDVAYDPDAAGAYDAVTWARQSGVLTGFADGTFCPDSPITREQFAAASSTVGRMNSLPRRQRP